MPQRYIGVGRIPVLGNNGEAVEVQMCNGCGGLVVNETKHNEFHVRLGDDEDRRLSHREQVDRVKFGIRGVPDRGFQVGDGNVQNNSFGGS